MQAEVYFATWRKYGDAEASIIPEGQRVAIKLTRNHLGGGVFEQPEGPLELHIAGEGGTWMTGGVPYTVDC